jgi:hypothetical protein
VINRSIRVSLIIVALTGCAGRQVREKDGVRRDVATATMAVRVDSTMPEGVARAMAMADSATRAGAARLGRVELRPDSLLLRVGARYPLASLAVTFRDSAGVPIEGIVPHYGVSARVARINNAFELEALDPGRAELRVRSMTSRGAPRPNLPAGIVRLIVQP